MHLHNGQPPISDASMANQHGCGRLRAGVTRVPSHLVVCVPPPCRPLPLPGSAAKPDRGPVRACSVAKFGSNACLGHRPISCGQPGPYEWLTYAEVGERVNAIASGMMALGLKAHGRVGVYGINSPEWMMAMQACPASLDCLRGSLGVGQGSLLRLAPVRSGVPDVSAQ